MPLKVGGGPLRGGPGLDSKRKKETRDSETGRDAMGSGSLPHGQPAPAQELAPDLGPPPPPWGACRASCQGPGLPPWPPPYPRPLDSSGLCPHPHRPRCPGCLGLVGSGGLLASAPPPAPGASRPPRLSLLGSPSASRGRASLPTMPLSLSLPLLCPSFSLSVPKSRCLSSSLHPNFSAGLRPVEFPRPLNQWVLLSQVLASFPGCVP